MEDVRKIVEILELRPTALDTQACDMVLAIHRIKESRLMNARDQGDEHVSLLCKV